MWMDKTIDYRQYYCKHSINLKYSQSLMQHCASFSRMQAQLNKRTGLDQCLVCVIVVVDSSSAFCTHTFISVCKKTGSF